MNEQQRMGTDYVVLVDERDNDIGVMEKLQAHREGRLHRAFSVFIFNSKKELLLQQRAAGKYHSAGLWTNTCCSHPRPNETVKDAANRRLFEEMGLSCELSIQGSFIYRTDFDNGLTEHELDHILTGHSDAQPNINPEEVGSYRWMSLQDIRNAINEQPEQFTSWFRIAIEHQLIGG